MNVLYKTYASVLGIGYIKGGGSIAAAFYCIIYYVSSLYNMPVLAVSLAVLVLLTGIGASNILEAEWGKDSSKIVIDEVSGMQIGLLFVSPELLYVCIAFVLFRFFDMVKPLYIRKMERFPKGQGVMFDDVLAGIYTNLILQIIVVVIK